MEAGLENQRAYRKSIDTCQHCTLSIRSRPVSVVMLIKQVKITNSWVTYELYNITPFMNMKCTFLVLKQGNKLSRALTRPHMPQLERGSLPRAGYARQRSLCPRQRLCRELLSAKAGRHSTSRQRLLCREPHLGLSAKDLPRVSRPSAKTFAVTAGGHGKVDLCREP